MARFRKRARRAFAAARKGVRRYGKSSDSNPMQLIIPALAYGATRGYLSNMAAPLTSKIPLGTYADEAVFGTLGYFMAKKGKGMVKSAGKAILIVEAASLGNQLAGKFGSSGTSGSTVSNFDNL